MNEADRIRLAEAMGLRCVGCTYIENKYGVKEFAPDACCDIHGFSPYGFNPYTDANDDYAVLEWMRNRVMDNQDYTPEEWDQWCDFVRRMHDVSGDVPGYYSPQTAYRIGDYARAALKVLDK